ncbi:MAG: YidC/Oxa1 family insertase periplasmic-domain containing protein [Planctomycetota bacterium]|jgi:YidC/Oxa1 family membrane protein insertase
MEQQQQQPQSSGMMGRLVLFFVLALGILLFNAPRPEKGDNVAQNGEEQVDDDQDPADDGAPDPGDDEGKAKPKPDQPPEGKPGEIKEPDDAKVPAEKPQAPQPARVAPPPRLLILGSLDERSSYRMQVAVTNVGAAVRRIDLTSGFGDVDDRSSYLGHQTLDKTAQGAGCQVDVVGLGTPAAKAGLAKGDVITEIAGQRVTGFASLRDQLQKRWPGQTVQLTVDRQGEPLTLDVTLGRRPLAIVRPEAGADDPDPLSFLLTLDRVGDQKLEDRVDELQGNQGANDETGRDRPRDETVGLELDGLDLHTGTWDVADEDRFDEAGPHNEVTFFRELPELGLKIYKTYRLAEVPEEHRDDDNYRAYHLELSVKIENIGGDAQKVAYQLGGPTGLPTEGKWYASKVTPSWSTCGLRDVVHAWQGGDPIWTPCPQLDYGNDTDTEWPWEERAASGGQEGQLLAYMGVDAQYFAVMVIPNRSNDATRWFRQLQPLRVGAVDKVWKKMLTNTSCRLTSLDYTLEPGGGTLEHTFTVFAGPKRPRLLEEYGLRNLVYYGWYSWAAKPMVLALHFFYSFVGNYGLAIIMLTVVVRSCMFPLSRKQALGARKMQEIQPELRRIQQKHKNNLEARAKAQRELFRKHNYNPASGCLVLLVQLPIFIGLYRGLMVDVELRQAPLLSESIRWCSDLSAPDMLLEWTGFTPEFFFSGRDFWQLGPYFNVLPILTVILFLMQQKMFMPPPADDQQRMQQRIMKFMMLFMGLIFFKVASGLCLYFIASSLWGVAERKLLPKSSPTGAGGQSAAAKLPPKAGRDEATRPKTPQPRPGQSTSPQTQADRFKSGASSDDGRSPRRKKKRKKKSRGK